MKTILIVEDDPVISDIYACCFRSRGYTVHTAPHLFAALSELDALAYWDFITLDIMMGTTEQEVTPQEFLEKALPKAGEIVVLSNAADSHILAHQYRALGVKTIMPKINTPFEFIPYLEASPEERIAMQAERDKTSQLRYEVLNDLCW